MSNIIGFEAANSYVKVKSALGEDVYVNTVRLLEDNEDTFLGSSSEAVFEIDGLPYSVGETVHKSAKLTVVKEADRYANALYRVASLIALSKHIKDGGEYTVVTGLPAAHINDEKAKELLRKTLEGTHRVKVRGNTITFRVKLRIILQPLGTLMALAYDSEGRLKDKALMQALKVIIDIGWGTTDVAIMDGKNLIKPIAIDYAMQDIYKLIARRLKNELKDEDGNPVITGEINIMRLEQQLKRGDEFEIAGVTYNVGEVKRQCFELGASRIMNDIKADVTLADYDFTLLTGGGFKALAEYLRPHVQGIRVKKPTDEQIANAAGFYNYGIVIEGGV